MKLINFLTIPFFKPKVAYEHLLRSEKKVLISTLLMLGLGILYTVTIIIGYRQGFGAVIKPILPIQAEKYYFYQMFFVIPILFLISFTFAAISRFLAKSLGGNGRFLDNYVIYITASVIPTFLLMWLPETILFVFYPDLRASRLGGFNLLPDWLDSLRQITGMIWPMIISLAGIKVSEGISYFKSAIVSIISFSICGVIVVIFIR